MRMVFLSCIVLFYQLFTFGLAKGIFWFSKPYFSISKTILFITIFIISNLFLAGLFFGKFRLTMSWLAILWFVMMTFGLTFLTSLASQRFQLSPNYPHAIRTVSVLIFISLIAMSIYNAYTPTVRYLNLKIDKPINKPIKLAMVSDLHLGQLFGSKQLYQLAHILNQERVDMLLMPGDIMDDDTHIYDEKHMKPAFEAVVKSANHQVYASLGNHDLYNNQQRFAIASAIKETGAVLLDDKTASTTINGTPITIIGRFDDHATNRKNTQELLLGVDTDNLVILLDHRPSQIDQNAKLSIDLQVSGHTHNGQIFPANFIVKALNTIAYGYGKVGNMHVIVSSGYGFWGVPFRLGSQSEVWVVTLTN